MTARLYTHAEMIDSNSRLNTFLSLFEAEKANHRGQITEHARWLYGQAQGIARTMHNELPALPKETYPAE